MLMNTMPAYNALDGTEVVKLICKQIYDELLKSGAFRQHITYPSFRWTARLDFEWSSQDVQMGVEGKQAFTISGKQGEKEPNENVIIEVKGSSSRAPDTDRDKAGVEKPRVSKTSTGLVDYRKPN